MLFRSSKKAGAIFRPRIENAVIFVIIEGIPQVLKPANGLERLRKAKTRRKQPDNFGSRAILPTITDDFTRQ